jgi:hypothetical protein
MERARSHRRLAGAGAFALLALVAEIVGRSLTVSLDLGRARSDAALCGRGLLPVPARVREGRRRADARRAHWRFVRARAAARAARRLMERGRCTRAQHAARPDPAHVAELGARLRAHGRDLPRADRHRALLPPGSGRSCRRGCTRRRSPSSPFSPCSSRCLRRGRRAGSPTTSAYARDARPQRVRSPSRRVALAGSHRGRRELRSSARLFGLAFESRPPPVRRKPGRTPGLSSTREEEMRLRQQHTRRTRARSRTRGSGSCPSSGR